MVDVSPSPQPTVGPAGEGWVHVQPDPPGILGAIAAAASNDIWAVGSDAGCLAQAGQCEPLAMHWDGSAWTLVETPKPSGEVHLRAVATLSSTDAWAVGSYADADGASLTLILHWDGTAWTQVSSPSPDRSSNGLDAVVATSPTNAWAVGYAGNDPLLVRWNGQEWISEELPDLGRGFAALEAVAATSESDAWAVGTYRGCAQLILHWDGDAWSKDAFDAGGGPPCFGAGSSLVAVTALSPTDAWAVGNTGCCSMSFPSIVHWNGEQWSDVPFEADLGGFDLLTGIAATAADDVWAVGSTGDGFEDSEMLILHWDGTRWSPKDSPTPLKYAGGVVGLSTFDAWASGEVFLHWTGE